MDELTRLIDELPEIYQPIYGLDLEGTSRRSDDPRIAAMTDIVDEVERALGRPLRVLDIGCAQGFTTMVIAERGHRVVGIDYLPANVDVCRELGRRHPALDVRFEVADVIDLAPVWELGEYDLVVCLSVLHHILAGFGAERTAEVVREIQEHAPFGLFEMALASEPMPWAAALPASPHQTLAPYPFVRTVAWSPTHLSDIDRPLMFASRTHALVAGKLHELASTSDSSHGADHALYVGHRRYFETTDLVGKIVAHFAENAQTSLEPQLRAEMVREAEVLGRLQNVRPGTPRLLELSDGPLETLIVRERLVGERLDLVCAQLDDRHRDVILDQVLDELVELARLGAYHHDLRLWNVLWDRERREARVIDYGSMEDQPGDLVWPHDPAYALVMFILALWDLPADDSGLFVARVEAERTGKMPTHVAAMVSWLGSQLHGSLDLDAALTQWRRCVAGGVPVVPDTNDRWWLRALGARYLSDLERLSAESERSRSEMASLATAVETSKAAADALRAEVGELQRRVTDIELERDELQARLAATEVARHDTQRQLDAVYASETWRVGRSLWHLGRRTGLLTLLRRPVGAVMSWRYDRSRPG